MLSHEQAALASSGTSKLLFLWLIASAGEAVAGIYPWATHLAVLGVLGMCCGFDREPSGV